LFSVLQVGGRVLGRIKKGKNLFDIGTHGNIPAEKLISGVVTVHVAFPSPEKGGERRGKIIKWKQPQHYMGRRKHYKSKSRLELGGPHRKTKQDIAMKSRGGKNCPPPIIRRGRDMRKGRKGSIHSPERT